MDIGDAVKIMARRGEESITVELKPVATFDKVPGDIPAAQASSEQRAGDRPQVGAFAVKLPEFKNECSAYVPDSYNAATSYGLVVWLHPPGGTKDEELLARWKEACDRLNLILLAPRSADPARWMPPEVGFVAKTIEQMRDTYNVDPLRIVLNGQQAGGSLAYIVAFTRRDLFAVLRPSTRQSWGAPQRAIRPGLSTGCVRNHRQAEHFSAADFGRNRAVAQA